MIDSLLADHFEPLSKGSGFRGQGHTTVTTITAQVIDTNHRPKGAMPVQVEFDAEGPARAKHAGQVYRYTGKSGHNRATGLAVREMATIDDARLWITLDGTQVWED